MFSLTIPSRTTLEEVFSFLSSFSAKVLQTPIDFTKPYSEKIIPPKKIKNIFEKTVEGKIIKKKFGKKDSGFEITIYYRQTYYAKTQKLPLPLQKFKIKSYGLKKKGTFFLSQNCQFKDLHIRLNFKAKTLQETALAFFFETFLKIEAIYIPLFLLHQKVFPRSATLPFLNEETWNQNLWLYVAYPELKKTHLEVSQKIQTEIDQLQSQFKSKALAHQHLTLLKILCTQRESLDLPIDDLDHLAIPKTPIHLLQTLYYLKKQNNTKALFYFQKIHFEILPTHQKMYSKRLKEKLKSSS